MKILINIVALSLLLSSPVYAGYYTGNIARLRIHADNSVVFGTTGQPPGTCSSYGEYFLFDISTATGAAMYSMLLALKAQNKQVQIWYNESKAPGTTEASGCDASSIAKVTGVGES